MAEDPDESLWRARLRWRLRGAWQAPTFVVLTLVEAVLLNRLPISGDSGSHVVGAFLLCGFFNLTIVALLAPLLARMLQGRTRADVPRSVAQDRAATALMCALALGLLSLGIAHRPSVSAANDDYAAQLGAVRQYVAHQAPPQYRAGIGAEEVWKQKDGFYRTCVPGPDPRRSLCLFVETDGVPTVTLDPDQQSNSRIAGPDNPGRRGP